MKIVLADISKKYQRDWIFKKVNLQLSIDTPTAIIGPNGSGKSTLLQVIAGNVLPNKGDIYYEVSGKTIQPDHFYQYLDIVAPYLELPEEFTLKEFIDFHFSFKQIKKGLDKNELPLLMQLDGAQQKQIKNFSTGMRQRLKLGIAFFSECPLLFLDEPATNLDINGLNWYHENVSENIGKKLILVCSNREEEYSFCDKKINVLTFK